MPSYNKRNRTSATTNFGNGETLTIFFRKGIDTVNIARDCYAQQQEISDAAEVIEKLKEKRRASQSVDEFREISAQIREWEKLPSQLDACDAFLFEVGESWDHYDSKEDEEQGKPPVPFTLENIKLIHYTRRMMVMTETLKALGFGADEDPKASLTSSPQQSIPEAREASNSLDGPPN